MVSIQIGKNILDIGTDTDIDSIVDSREESALRFQVLEHHVTEKCLAFPRIDSK